jgi:hypothetical protein
MVFMIYLRHSDVWEWWKLRVHGKYVCRGLSHLTGTGQKSES